MARGSVLPSPSIASQLTRRRACLRPRFRSLAILLFSTLCLWGLYLTFTDDPESEGWLPSLTESRWISRLSPLKPLDENGNYQRFVQSDESPTSFEEAEQTKRLWRERADSVKSSFLHAWSAYEKFAWSADELMPLNLRPVKNFNGWGVTIVDSLDTLLLFNLKPQFVKAMDHVANMTFRQNTKETAPFFETVIRYLGGLLSAYALIVDDNLFSDIPWLRDGSNTSERDAFAKTLLDRAEALADALIPAFDTRSGLPTWGVNTLTGETRGSSIGGSLLAEIASFQMEFKYLAHVTGRKKYFDVAQNVIDILDRLQWKQLRSRSRLGGMLPTIYRVDLGEPIDDHITVGALGDSAYEYFLKGYLLSNRTETRLLKMHLTAAETALKKLVFVSREREITYITDSRGGAATHEFQHLSCFYPGLLALGVQMLSSSKDTSARSVEIQRHMKERHLLAAEALAEGCWLLYADNPTGLSNENVRFSTFHKKSSFSWWTIVDKWERSGRPTYRPRGNHGTQLESLALNHTSLEWQNKEYRLMTTEWRMRPETIESLFLMFRLTHDPIWRERCYSIYQAIEHYSRVEHGYATVMNANDRYRLDRSSADWFEKNKWRWRDSMPSYALAETFKYLYLCMLEPEEAERLLPARRWIFNTEAHPFPVFDWTEEQRQAWGIR